MNDIVFYKEQYCIPVYVLAPNNKIPKISGYYIKKKL